MIEWEYQTIWRYYKKVKEMDVTLNELGKEGWELMNLDFGSMTSGYETKSWYRATFKRMSMPLTGEID